MYLHQSQRGGTAEFRLFIQTVQNHFDCKTPCCECAFPAGSNKRAIRPTDRQHVLLVHFPLLSPPLPSFTHAITCMAISGAGRRGRERSHQPPTHSTDPSRSPLSLAKCQQTCLSLPSLAPKLQEEIGGWERWLS